jgi:hypothetical protein
MGVSAEASAASGGSLTAAGGGGDAGQVRVVLSWSGIAGNVDVQRSPQGAGSWTTLATNQVAYTDTACDTSQTGFTGYWDYRVAATGTTNWSNTATASPYVLCDLWSGTAGTNVSGRTPNVSSGGPSSGDTWHLEDGAIDLDGSGDARNNSTSESIAVSNTGASDLTLVSSVKFSSFPSSNGLYIRGRDTDVNNGWIMGIESSGDKLNLYKQQSGSYTSMASTTGVGGSTGTFYGLTLTLSGTSITGSTPQNSKSVGPVTSSFNQTATRCGFQSEQGTSQTGFFGIVTATSP